MGDMEMKHLLNIRLGEGFGPDFGRSKDTYFYSNYGAKEVRQAYKDSCKLTGVQFNSTGYDCIETDFTGLGLGTDSPRLIWVRGDDKGISDEALEILNKHGLLEDFKEVEEIEEDGCSNEEYAFEESDDEFDINEYGNRKSPYDFSDNKHKIRVFIEDGDPELLIMKFIALSMPKDFVFERYEIEAEPINTYNNDLCVEFGHGIL